MASVKDELRKGALSSLKRAKNSLFLDAADVKKKSVLSKTPLSNALQEDFAKTEFDEEFDDFDETGEIGDFSESGEAQSEQDESLDSADTSELETNKDELVLLLRKKQIAFSKLLADQTCLPLLIKCSEVPQDGEMFEAFDSFDQIVTNIVSNPDEFSSEYINIVLCIINATLSDLPMANKGVEFIWALKQGEVEKMSEILKELVELQNENEEGLEESLYEDYEADEFDDFDDDDEDEDYYYYDDDDDDLRR